jgi:acetoacetate decarboxylase
MANDPSELYNAPGDIRTWPTLQVDYPTDPDRIAALLPPGIEPSGTADVHLSFYHVPVPDEPEYGVKITVDADYRGTKGQFAIGYAIDQEAAVYISKDATGQPKYLAEIEYWRLKEKVRARAMHAGYTFLEYAGKVTGQAELPESLPDRWEWWIKVSRSVSRAEKTYDFPPHVVTVKDSFEPVLCETVEGELILRESPWDPIAELLPMRGDPTARLVTNKLLNHDIQLAAPLDPEAFWPFMDTIGSSRWPGVLGGPRREVDFSAYLE